MKVVLMSTDPKHHPKDAPTVTRYCLGCDGTITFVGVHGGNVACRRCGERYMVWLVQWMDADATPEQRRPHWLLQPRNHDRLGYSEVGP